MSTQEETARYIRWTKRGLIGLAVFLVLTIGGCATLAPQYRLYNANTQKRVLITDARARSDAAQYEAQRQVEIANSTAEADRIRAQGVADSNRIIAASITPEYTQWLYVDQLDKIAASAGSKIIYLPSNFTPAMVTSVGTGE